MTKDEEIYHLREELKAAGDLLEMFKDMPFWYRLVFLFVGKRI